MSKLSHYERIKRFQEIYQLILDGPSFLVKAKEQAAYGIKVHKIIEALPGEVEESPSD